MADDAEPVAEPLHRGAGDEDRAFERVGPLALELVGDGGEQPVPRHHRLVAGVEQREAAGAVGRLEHARLEAGLADRRRLLVAGDAEDRDRRAEDRRLGRPVVGGAVPDLGEDGAGHVEDAEQFVVPRAVVDVEEHRPRGVGRVGGVDLAAGEPPDQERVDRAEGELAALGLVARALHPVEQPGDLGRGEIRVEEQAGPGRDLGLDAGLAKRGAGARRCGGPARRWRDGSASRSCGSRSPSSRAGW